jgi:hypothetical protein
MTTLAEIRSAFPDGELKGKDWFTKCPDCGKHALSIKPGDKAPVVAYCMRCEKDFTAEIAKRFSNGGPAATEPRSRNRRGSPTGKG